MIIVVVVITVMTATHIGRDESAHDNNHDGDGMVMILMKIKFLKYLIFYLINFIEISWLNKTLI